jgi:hypothetical protein
MKIIFKVFPFFPLLATFILACNKNNSSKINNDGKIASVLTLSKSRVKRGEQLFVSTNAADTNSSIRCAVKPSVYARVLAANNQAAAIFPFAGTYQITASYYSASDTLVAYDSSSAAIIVKDSIYSPLPIGSNTDTLSLAGDQIKLRPIAASDSGFVMSVETSNLYNCTPYLTACGWEQGPSTLGFLFNSALAIVSKNGCDGAKNPAIAYLFFTPLSNGTYNISGIFNQVNYQGGLTVTSTDYTFTWNYTTGIIISPLQIKKL